MLLDLYFHHQTHHEATTRRPPLAGGAPFKPRVIRPSIMWVDPLRDPRPIEEDEAVLLACLM